MATTIQQEPAPTRLSPFHHRQTASGAQFAQDEFGWLIAERFTDPTKEKGGAQRTVGIADISHLTKLSIKSRDVTGTISGLYNRTNGTAVGTVLTNGPTPLENVLCALLCKDEALLITSSSRKDAASKHLQLNNPGSFTLTDVASVLAGLYVVGPKGRLLVQKLTELNVNPEHFPNLKVTHSPLRHVPSIIVRFDLRETLGYQIYFERAYGEYIWDAIFSAGKEFNVIPVGSACLEMLGWKWG
jgi:aminomethyltransferase